MDDEFESLPESLSEFELLFELDDEFEFELLLEFDDEFELLFEDEFEDELLFEFEDEFESELLLEFEFEFELLLELVELRCARRSARAFWRAVKETCSTSTAVEAAKPFFMSAAPAALAMEGATSAPAATAAAVTNDVSFFMSVLRLNSPFSRAAQGRRLVLRSIPSAFCGEPL